MKKLLILLLLSTSLSSFADYLDFTLSDFCYQQPNVQDRGGIYFFPNEEVGITAVSLCVYKDQYGQYESKGKLKNGSQDGEWTEWYENGQISSEANYKNGELDGKWTTWYKNGQLYNEMNFKDGEAVGKWTGWHENGQMKYESNWKDDVVADGKKDGKHTEWYENGQKSYEGNYIDGKADGKWTVWFDNGQKSSEKELKDGKKDGKWIEWGITGKIIRESEWKDGECISGDWCADKLESELKLDSALIVTEDQLNTLKSAYVNNIAARVKSYWRYQGAKYDWTCQVYVKQDREGNIQAVNVQNCNLDDSEKARAFKNSIERAVYKASPLPVAPDDAVFDSEITFTFSVD